MTAQGSSNRRSTPRRRPGPSDSHSRERLLDEALKLFAERGIANTTLAQIAEAAEVTSAMVHYRFESRDKLLDAIVEERLAPQIREIWEPADFARESVLEVIQGIARRVLSIIDHAPWLPPLWLREIIQEGGMLRERVMQRIPDRKSMVFRNIVAEAQRSGEINPQLSPDLLFISLMALLMVPHAAATIRGRLSSSPPLDNATIDRHVLSLLTHGLSPSEAGQPPKADVL
ncbi:TetR/AcrR family transcriptional regulator [Ralstonia insidiosa]|nr:TetR/AcrR family transcriptional regulator [Ralstonia insidiosa]